MVSIRECSITRVNIWDDVFSKSLAKTCAGREVPVPVVREDNDERLCFTGEDQIINSSDRTEANPLIGGIGLSVQEVEDGVMCIGLFIVAWRQIDEIRLRGIYGFEKSLFHAAGLGKTCQWRGGWGFSGR
jgi:hypothetical protein